MAPSDMAQRIGSRHAAEKPAGRLVRFTVDPFLAARVKAATSRWI
jgi:hypothetical protein